MGHAALQDIVSSGRRLSFDEAVALYNEAPLLELGRAAHAVRLRKHPEPVVTYVIDRNINYTNVCYVDCAFCAFYVRPGVEEDARGERAYVLPHEEIGKKIDETKALGGTQILLQGGHHPDLKIDYYEDLFRYIKKNHPIHLHALSPPEVMHIVKVSKITLDEALDRLIEAGLDSIPGGGAEILTDRVREVTAPRKATAQEWLDVMEAAHRKGLRTTATMMFGSVDTVEDRVEHLLKLRDLQDRTGGFTAFICWAYQRPGPENHALGLDLEARDTSAHTYLKTLALARLVLDNFENLQSSWVTMGHGVGQLSLQFGSNDFGSLMIEENVVSRAGVDYCMSLEYLEHLILDTGYTPKRRNMFYEVLN
ncbi:MAG: dehypoxanthine futalosine cyclase [Acidobacteriota bacterium]|nr:MAG: dehypoxanthine futalosine cyclase [Acidobacteriota bacterium]